jgi:hypothetical protein
VHHRIIYTQEWNKTSWIDGQTIVSIPEALIP